MNSKEIIEHCKSEGLNELGIIHVLAGMYDKAIESHQKDLLDIVNKLKAEKNSIQKLLVVPHEQIYYT